MDDRFSFRSAPNTAAIYGDPNVLGFSESGKLSFFISSLASSESAWQSLGPDGNDCLPISDYGTGIDSICVWEADFTEGSNNAPVVSSSYCVGGGAGFNVDGTNLMTDGSSVYLTSHNFANGTAAVWQDGVLVQPQPPFVSISSHSIFAKGGAGTGGITVIAPDNNLNFNATSWTGSGWTPVIQIGSSWNPNNVALGNGISVRNGVSYAATWTYPARQ